MNIAKLEWVSWSLCKRNDQYRHFWMDLCHDFITGNTKVTSIVQIIHRILVPFAMLTCVASSSTTHMHAFVHRFIDICVKITFARLSICLKLNGFDKLIWQKIFPQNLIAWDLLYTIWLILPKTLYSCCSIEGFVHGLTFLVDCSVAVLSCQSVIKRVSSAYDCSSTMVIDNQNVC